MPSHAFKSFSKDKEEEVLEVFFYKKMIKSKIVVKLGSNDGHFVMVMIWLLHMFTTINMVVLLKLFWSFLGANIGVTTILGFVHISFLTYVYS
jgi:hypothetical protein